jgi:hypothetical protein
LPVGDGFNFSSFQITIEIENYALLLYENFIPSSSLSSPVIKTSECSFLSFPLAINPPLQQV